MQTIQRLVKNEEKIRKGREGGKRDRGFICPSQEVYSKLSRFPTEANLSPSPQSDHKLPPRPRPPLPPLRSLSRPHSIASNPNSRSNSPIPSSFSSTSLARNPSYSTSTTTSDGYLQPSPSISSSTSRVRPTSLYSTPSFTSTRSDGTRLQAKSALTERTTREDLKSLKDMFDMGPEDFDPSPSPLPTSSNQSSSYTLPISYPQISNSHFSPTSSPSSELGGIIRPKTESRTEQVRREEDKRESVRKRRPEAMEWSQTCWVWSTSGKEGNHNVKEGKDGSSVGCKFSSFSRFSDFWY